MTVPKTLISSAPFISEHVGSLLPEIPSEDLRKYSLTRALRIAGGGQSGRGTRESEIADAMLPAASRMLGHSRSIQGFVIPLDIPGSLSIGGSLGMRAALDTGTATAGAELVFTAPGSLLDGLRARSVLGSLGATFMEVQLPLKEPRLATDAVVTWVAEDPGSDLADTEPTLASVDYVRNTLAAVVPYSRQLFAQSYGVRGVDQLVARAVESAIATELDRVGLNGSGASNQPTGILSTAGIGDVAIGTNGGAPAYAHIIDLELDVAVADADANRLGFATTPGVRAKLRQTERAPGSAFVWAGSQMLGWPARVTSNVPSNLSKGTGTNLHGLIFGNWADLVIAVAPFLDVVVDPYSLKKQGVVEVIYFLYCDVQLRHAASFSAIQDATA